VKVLVANANNQTIAMLRNVLDMEAHRNYQDTAVAGGLHRFSESWSRQARLSLSASSSNAGNLIDEIMVCLHNYQVYQAEARKAKISRALALLDRLVGGTGTPTPPSPVAPALRPTLGTPSTPPKPLPKLRANSMEEGDDSQPPAASLPQASAAELLIGQERRKPYYTIPTMPTLEERVGRSGELPAPPRALVEERTARTAADTALSSTLSPDSLDAPITRLKGASEKVAALFEHLGVQTIREMIYFFPRRHDDFSQLHRIHDLSYGALETVIGTVRDTFDQPTKRGFTLFRATIEDETGSISVTWFNQRWLARSLYPGKKVVISGKVDEYNGRLTFNSPAWEEYTTELTHTGRLVPVYPLTEGLTPQNARRLVKQALDNYLPLIEDFLPADLLKRTELMPLREAIMQAHFPADQAQLARAHKRLAFDEFLLIQLGMQLRRKEWQEDQPGNAIQPDRAILDQWIADLGLLLTGSAEKAASFNLTGAQKRAIDDILADMANPLPMSRMLQGDVGSGKTLVAAIAMAAALTGGYQAVIMAPTEILAEQHYRTFSRIFAGLRLPTPEGTLRIEKQVVDGQTRLGELVEGGGRQPEVRMLSGRLKVKEKRKVYQEAAAGTADIVIGTHALIQEKLEFANLGVVVIDEQHRFGVLQRNALRQKGHNPDTLVMTATPIPRSLALTMYGDLDVGVIDEKPVGRLPIKTKWLAPDQRNSAYKFIRKMVAEGRQAFVICPLVEESDKVEAKAAVEEAERLQRDVFPDLRVGLVHGRLASDKKEAAMQAFNRGELDILVSTSVVEVGIDVPNATVMMIEGANRFGLSQLHQFRGRVGRGEHQSYCMLLADSVGVIAEERLKVIESSEDGFVLAEADLKLRGPGQFFGTRQSGFSDLKMASFSDLPTLELARREAKTLFASDPTLKQAEHHRLRVELEAFWAGREPAAEG